MLHALLPDRPLVAAELNARWAAARLPFRLNRHGVAHLWAICAADAAVPQPLLFIVGREPRAVSQAQRWAATLAHDKTASAAASRG